MTYDEMLVAFPVWIRRVERVEGALCSLHATYLLNGQTQYRHLAFAHTKDHPLCVIIMLGSVPKGKLQFAPSIEAFGMQYTYDEGYGYLRGAVRSVETGMRIVVAAFADLMLPAGYEQLSFSTKYQINTQEN